MDSETFPSIEDYWLRIKRAIFSIVFDLDNLLGTGNHRGQKGKNEEDLHDNVMLYALLWFTIGTYVPRIVSDKPSYDME